MKGKNWKLWRLTTHGAVHGVLHLSIRQSQSPNQIAPTLSEWYSKHKQHCKELRFLFLAWQLGVLQSSAKSFIWFQHWCTVSKYSHSLTALTLSNGFRLSIFLFLGWDWERFESCWQMLLAIPCSMLESLCLRF
jgi:hypothetical protein